MTTRALLEGGPEVTPNGLSTFDKTKYEEELTKVHEGVPRLEAEKGLPCP